MAQTVAEGGSVPANEGQRTSLCFVLDPDFGFLQGFSKSLRSVGVDTLELISSARLAENVDDQNPDIIFLDLNPANPYECVLALMSLKECRFSGRVQLLGRCEPTFLETFRKVGVDASLAMLPVLRKPVDSHPSGRLSFSKSSAASRSRLLSSLLRRPSPAIS
jgi:hypothetical protein